jgi:hypothetical protein
LSYYSPSRLDKKIEGKEMSNEELITGWHLGFNNIVHLISPVKSHNVSWGRVSITFCGLLTDGWGGYDPFELIKKYPNMNICKKCAKFYEIYKKLGEQQKNE